MAAANRVWGAPRVHGELLKLGIIVSERTVSRYLPDRLRAPSQTWRTFLANHFSQFAFMSPASRYATGADDVVGVSGLARRQSPLFRDELSTSQQCAIVYRSGSLQRTSVAQIVSEHLHDRIAARHSSGRDPPTQGRLPPIPVSHAEDRLPSDFCVYDERPCRTSGRGQGARLGATDCYHR